MHCIYDLIQVFNHTFQEQYNTQLVRGDGEPIYLPANTPDDFHQIVFANDFFSSGLHEISHWLIAGKKRRRLEDYGYWYKPDGRDALQQAEFERVEVKPQAIEWIMSEAAGYPFRISQDNLNGHASNPGAFKQNILNQVQAYCTNGLSKRASQFRLALCQFYKTPISLDVQAFVDGFERI